MATVTLPVPADLIDQLNSGAIAIDQLLIPIVKDNPKNICEQLRAFHEDEDGSPVVGAFDVATQDCSYDAAAHRGKIAFHYKVNYSFGCSDVNRDVPLMEKADFVIDRWGIQSVSIFMIKWCGIVLRSFNAGIQWEKRRAYSITSPAKAQANYTLSPRRELCFFRTITLIKDTPLRPSQEGNRASPAFFMVNSKLKTANCSPFRVPGVNSPLSP